MFDTNAISALVHQRRSFERLAALAESMPIGERLVSAITMSEIETMIAKAADPGTKSVKVRLILTHFNIVDFDEVAAVHAGQIHSLLEPKGMSIGPLDTLIAAHARSLGAAVVTENIKEFARVPGLTVETWLHRN